MKTSDAREKPISEYREAIERVARQPTGYQRRKFDVDVLRYALDELEVLRVQLSFAMTALTEDAPTRHEFYKTLTSMGYKPAQVR